MKWPYVPGQQLAWLDSHPDGVRIHRATVIHIEATDQHDHWHITTDRGDATVDHLGASGHVLPLDEDIATELYIRGDGYLVFPSHIDHQYVLELESRDAQLTVDQGDDLGID